MCFRIDMLPSRAPAGGRPSPPSARRLACRCGRERVGSTSVVAKRTLSAPCRCDSVSSARTDQALDRARSPRIDPSECADVDVMTFTRRGLRSTERAGSDLRRALVNTDCVIANSPTSRDLPPIHTVFATRSLTSIIEGTARWVKGDGGYGPKVDLKGASAFTPNEFELLRLAWGILVVNIDIAEWAVAMLGSRPGDAASARRRARDVRRQILDGRVTLKARRSADGVCRRKARNNNNPPTMHAGSDTITVCFAHPIIRTTFAKWALAGGNNTKLCIAAGMAAVLLHEVCHFHGINHGSFGYDKVACNVNKRIANTFLYGLMWWRLPDVTSAAASDSASPCHLWFDVPMNDGLAINRPGTCYPDGGEC